MFPISVDPRAKKKMMSLQPPIVYSFSAMPTFAIWRTPMVVGAAVAKPVSKKTGNIGFILAEEYQERDT